MRWCRVEQLFNEVVLQLFGRVEQVKARAAELYLVGVVCYYGRHYSSFFYHTRTRRWMYCDDEKVTEVRPHHLITSITSPNSPTSCVVLSVYKCVLCVLCCVYLSVCCVYKCVLRCVYPCLFQCVLCCVCCLLCI